jgi:hypothetical protein
MVKSPKIFVSGMVLSPTGHLEILSELGNLDKYIYVSDFTPKHYCFDTRFKVEIPTREYWNEASPPLNNGNTMVWYTDGSRMEDNSGLGIFGPNCEISQGLGKCPSVFQAEVLEIDFCARNISENGINGANIYILSDSQAALKAHSGLTNRRGVQKFSTKTYLA